MTSDMLEEQQQKLQQLGSSRKASLLRAELQGAHLLSGAYIVLCFCCACCNALYCIVL